MIRTLVAQACVALMACWLLAIPSPAQALQFQIDYSCDTGNFFSQNPAAKVSLEAAAHDLGALLATAPTEVGQHRFTASDSQQTVAVDWSFSFPHPYTRSPMAVAPYDAEHPLAVGTVTLFVGAGFLSGESLGQSAPVQPAVTWQVLPSGSAHGSLVQAVQAQAKQVMQRGEGPVMGTVSGYVSGQPYVIPYGLFGGSLSFDADRNNDGALDTPGVAGQYWHFDLATPPPSDRFDFYTVSLQLMLHAIGYGFAAGELGRTQVDGDDWRGANVIALLGSGEGVLMDGQINRYLLSPTLGGGPGQASVMAGGLAMGERRLLTTLDAAVLRDLSYRTVPEPGGSLLALTGGMLLAVRHRVRDVRKRLVDTALLA